MTARPDRTETSDNTRRWGGRSCLLEMMRQTKVKLFQAVIFKEPVQPLILFWASR
ncbi:hypothetical protein LEMLEM_LOCUS10218 [Lemmus lemmus]